MNTEIIKEESLIAINPDNSKQARVFLDLQKAQIAGDSRHPQKIMSVLEKECLFKVLDSVPQSMFDGWDFWITYENEPDLPDYFRTGLSWKPIGQV